MRIWCFQKVNKITILQGFEPTWCDLPATRHDDTLLVLSTCHVSRVTCHDGGWAWWRGQLWGDWGWRVSPLAATTATSPLSGRHPPPRTGRGHYGDTVIVIIIIVIIIISEQVASIPTPHQRQSPELLILRHLIPLMTFIGLHQSSVAISVKLVFPSCTGQVESVKNGSLWDIYNLWYPPPSP